MTGGWGVNPAYRLQARARKGGRLSAVDLEQGCEVRSVVVAKSDLRHECVRASRLARRSPSEPHHKTRSPHPTPACRQPKRVARQELRHSASARRRSLPRYHLQDGGLVGHPRPVRVRAADALHPPANVVHVHHSLTQHQRRGGTARRRQ